MVDAGGDVGDERGVLLIIIWNRPEVSRSREVRNKVALVRLMAVFVDAWVALPQLIGQSLERAALVLGVRAVRPVLPHDSVA